jgi:hypothetical protein
MRGFSKRAVRARKLVAALSASVGDAAIIV